MAERLTKSGTKVKYHGLRSGITKFEPLTSRDKNLLMILYRNNFDYVKSFDEVYSNDSEKLKYPKDKKIRYCSTWFSDRRKYAAEYIEGLIRDEFRDLFVTKEHLALKLMRIAEKNEKKNKVESDKVAIDIYKFISKLLGYSIDRIEIEKIEPVKIEYIIPKNSTSSVTNIEIEEISNPDESKNE